MHSIAWTGRVLSRAFVGGITSYYAENNANRKRDSHLVYAVCGFPKHAIIHATGKIVRGQIGEDAWFAAKHKTADVIGVADGVGGWRKYGIDPGEFSSFLMRTCERLVEQGNFSPTNPVDLLARSYNELQESKKPIFGSSTACVIIFNKDTSSIFTANIGDSGFVVVRQGEVVHRSEQQQHYFNAPYQLSVPPPSRRHVVTDGPEAADTSNFPVEDGDVILVATDGVFDNVPDSMLIPELGKLQGERDAAKIQIVANSIAWMARTLAFDSVTLSPFSQRAREEGIQASGGKPDDITVLLATVVL